MEAKITAVDRESSLVPYDKIHIPVEEVAKNQAFLLCCIIRQYQVASPVLSSHPALTLALLRQAPPGSEEG